MERRASEKKLGRKDILRRINRVLPENEAHYLVAISFDLTLHSHALKNDEKIASSKAGFSDRNSGWGPAMNPARSEFLNLRRLPGRLNVEEVAWLLGFSPGDIPVLVAVKLLKPLGKPAPNGVRYFARPDIDLLVADTRWLDKSTAALIAHWRTRNGKACSSSVPCPARN